MGEGDSVNWDERKKAYKMGSVGVCCSDLVAILHNTSILHGQPASAGFLPVASMSYFLFLYKGHNSEFTLML